MELGAGHKGKDLLHHVLSQTVNAVHRHLVGGQMVILLLFLNVDPGAMATAVILDSQCSFRRLGHDPDIKQSLLTFKLVDSPQRNTSCLSGTVVPESNELLIASNHITSHHMTESE